MQRSADWLEVRAALNRVVAAVNGLPAETVALDDALGRTLAQEIYSPIEHPPWDNSGMDGYAVRAQDVGSARADAPVALRIVERVPAGGFPQRAVGPGEATRIMTGAPIPNGADSVIRIEHTREDGAQVSILDAQDAGHNVRARGQDLRRGARVLPRGHLLRAAEIGLLATVGAARVQVTRQPRVAILSTGDELAGLDEFDEVLAGRKIANSNSHALAAAVRATGALPVPLGIARDDAQSLRTQMERAGDADVLVTTAGASVGDHDYVKAVVEELGYRLDFWRVRMRPGSPISFGWRDAGSQRQYTFGLPGNPVSALVTCELFLRPALRRLQGRADVFPRAFRVQAADPIVSKSGLTHFLRVRLQQQADGALIARLTGAQGSGLITSMTEADALLVVPEQSDGLAAGEAAWAIPLAAGDEASASIMF